MTTYRLMDGASGRPGVGSSGTTPPGVTSYSGAFQAGTVFYVSQGGMWLNGYYWWCPTGGDTGAQKFCLWQLTGVGSIAGTLVPNSAVTSGTLTAGAMNYVPLATPIPLSVGYGSGGAGGSAYLAATGWTAVNGFPDSNFQFASGDPYSAGITNGPLKCSGDPTAGGTGLQQADYSQGMFGTGNTGGAADPTLNMPAGSSNSANFWIDVLVSTTPPAGYNGSYRIWPNKFDVAMTATGIDLNDPYSLGTEFNLSVPCALDNIWFYSPSGASQLPTQCALWSVPLQAMVPGTLKTSPGWSGSAGSGWVSSSYTGVTIPPGDYKVAVWNASASGTGTGWNSYTIDYFTTLDGQNGITNGPISVPNVSSATSPGQATYANSGSTFLYPDTYVASEGQSYWVDIELTPVGRGLAVYSQAVKRAAYY